MRNFMREAQTIENLKVLLREQDLGLIINNNFFKNTLLYPTREAFEVRKVCKHCGSNYHDTEAYSKYKEALKEYQAEDGRLHLLFRDSLLLNHAIERTDKTNSIFHIAWDRGHSSGLHEVYLCFEEMVDILK